MLMRCRSRIAGRRLELTDNAGTTFVADSSAGMRRSASGVARGFESHVAQALEQAISRHRASGGRLVLDVNWRPTFWGLAADAEPTAVIQQQMQPLLRQADLLKLAAEEAEGLFSSRDPQAVAAALPQRPAVVVTDGGKGVSWSMGSASGSLPAYRVPVVDTTGAGDAFVGAFAHGLSTGLNPKDAISLAIDRASDSVTRKGTQISYSSDGA